MGDLLALPLNCQRCGGAVKVDTADASGPPGVIEQHWICPHCETLNRLNAAWRIVTVSTLGPQPVMAKAPQVVTPDGIPGPRPQASAPDVSERRQHRRLDKRFPGAFSGAGGAGAGIRDVSPTGCFVETFASLQAGTETVVTIRDARRELSLRARVAYLEAGMGFGVEFLGLSGDEKTYLAWLVEEGSDAPES